MYMNMCAFIAKAKLKLEPFWVELASTSPALFLSFKTLLCNQYDSNVLCIIFLLSHEDLERQGKLCIECIVQ